MVNLRKEKKEVLDALHTALGCAEGIRDTLGWASFWGIFDVLGGGFFVSIIKKNLIKEASRKAERLTGLLNNLNSELQDIGMDISADLESDSLIGFVDIFFDNALVDIYAQTKIGRAKKDVKELIVKLLEVEDEVKNNF